MVEFCKKCGSQLIIKEQQVDEKVYVRANGTEFTFKRFHTRYGLPQIFTKKTCPNKHFWNIGHSNSINFHEKGKYQLPKCRYTLTITDASSV